MNIAIIPKESRYTYTLKRSNLKASEVRDYLLRTGLSDKRVSAIESSHKRQQENYLKLLGKLYFHDGFHEVDTVSREDLTKECLNKYDLIISFGGDNHFQYVASFVEDVPIMGINSDPETSVGYLTKFHVDSPILDPGSPLIERGEFSVKPWTRLRASINGHSLSTLALSEIFIGEAERLIMSRCLVCIKGQEVSIRSSGIIAATGAGSSGWFSSAGGASWNPGDRGFMCLTTEPFANTVRLDQRGILESVEITSLNDTNGILSIDSLRKFPFPEGSVALIEEGESLNAVENA